MTETRDVATVGRRLARRAKERPDDVALAVIGGEQLTYGRWYERALSVAVGLQAEGVEPGNRVVVRCEPTALIEYGVAYAGVLLAGAVAVPVADVLGPDHRERARTASRAVLTLDPAADLARLERPAPEAVELPDVDPDSDAEILFTSGTTGTPKGVVASHRNLLHTHSADPRESSASVVLHAIGPGTLAGQGLLLQPLDGRPHRVVALPHFSPGAFLQAAQEHQVSDAVLVPAMAMSLVEAAHAFDDAAASLASVRRVRTMSAPVSPTTLARLDALFANATIFNMYTTTEAWPARLKCAHDPARPASVGRSERAGTVRVIGDDGRPTAIGMVGRVQLRLEDAPTRRFLDDVSSERPDHLAPDGWVGTGDLGYLDGDGYLFLVDREGDSINVGGLKVSSLEVEAALHEQPGVVEAAAFGLPHRRLGEVVAAAVCTNGRYSRDAVWAAVRRGLGDVKAPQFLVEVDELPRNAMRKVGKRELRERFRNVIPVHEHDGEVDTAAVADQVAAIWQAALGLDEVPDGMSFIALGGESVSITEVLAAVRDSMGVQVAYRDLSRAPDLEAFVRVVQAAAPVEDELAGPTRRVPVSEWRQGEQ